MLENISTTYRTTLDFNYILKERYKSFLIQNIRCCLTCKFQQTKYYVYLINIINYLRSRIFLYPFLDFVFTSAPSFKRTFSFEESLLFLPYLVLNSLRSKSY